MISKEILKQYEPVIGLEIHVELKTESKIFCGCSTSFGAPQNSQCCPVCTGMPGALPVLNKKAMEYGIKAGAVLNCEIMSYSRFDRKNYFYPDLPKAYQITQFEYPLCKNGYLEIDTKAGVKRIGITRIHLEEDAGKLIHDPTLGTLIDCNRCGVPLIEIVSEPEISDAEQAKEYVKTLRSLMLYAGVSDCKMNEGSLRCDVNLSVRKKGEKTLGTRTEMKNLNSFTFIGKAIEYEFARQVELIESGGKVVQETRRYDQSTGKTLSMRDKENAADYRYFPEPDLKPVWVEKEKITALCEAIPKLPQQRKKQYKEEFGLSDTYCTQLCELPQTAEYFEAVIGCGASAKTAANLLLSQVLSKLSEDALIPMAAQRLAAVCILLDDGKINNAAARKVIEALWEKDFDPESYVKEKDLLLVTDPAVLDGFAAEAIASDPKSVAAYRAGKTAAVQAIIGKALKLSGGRADPNLLREAVMRRIDQP